MYPDQDSDKIKQILHGCLNDDRKCQELLYKQFFGYAMKLSLRYTNNREEALEVVNDAFVKVFFKINKYNFERPFNLWLKRIVINTAIDSYRSQSKHYNHLDIDSVYNLPLEQSSPLDKMGYDELILVIKKLPKNFQINFNLYVFEGYRHEEISKMMKISVGTSKSNFSRAKAMLRRLLMEKEGQKVK